MPEADTLNAFAPHQMMPLFSSMSARPRALAGIGVGLPHPGTQCFAVDAQIGRDLGDGAVGATAV